MKSKSKDLLQHEYSVLVNRLNIIKNVISHTLSFIEGYQNYLNLLKREEEAILLEMKENEYHSR